jgi:hypothetical protein
MAAPFWEALPESTSADADMLADLVTLPQIRHYAVRTAMRRPP